VAKLTMTTPTTTMNMASTVTIPHMRTSTTMVPDITTTMMTT
jgi:hypothetical protein